MNLNPANSLLQVPSGNLVISQQTSVPNALDGESICFSLVLPTFNEAENIEEIIKILSSLLDRILPKQYELIVVDDNSPDRTWKLVEELTYNYPQLRVMRRTNEKGLSTAIIRGWQAAKGEVLGVIDADLQHPPELLLKLWQEIEKGVDLAVASRYIEDGGVSEWNIIRRFLSRGAQMLGLIILPEVISRLSDPMSGYFMVTRRAIAGKILNPLGYKILVEVVARGNIRFLGEAAYVFRERQAGGSKVTWKQYIEYLQHLIRLRLHLWPVTRFIRFGTVGFSGVFVDMGVFYLLREFLKLGLTRSAIVSSEVAIINNFLWNDLWTFRDISSQQKGWSKRGKRFLKFNIICLSGLILNVLLVNLFFNIFGINQYLAKIIAIILVTLWNFWFNLKLSWRVTDVKKN
jgi:dolichol-phosphate mannosyltransferase